MPPGPKMLWRPLSEAPHRRGLPCAKLAVVAAHAEDLVGARQWRLQLCSSYRGALCGAYLKMRFQVVVVGDEMDHCGLAAAGAEVPNVYYARIGQNTRLVVV